MSEKEFDAIIDKSSFILEAGSYVCPNYVENHEEYTHSYNCEYCGEIGRI